MGFCSVIVSEDRAIVWPAEFRRKWDKGGRGPLYVPQCGPLGTQHEFKLYDNELFRDIQKVVGKQDAWDCNGNFRVCVMHDCGGVTVAIISKDKVRLIEPTRWAGGAVLPADMCHRETDVTE